MRKYTPVPEGYKWCSRMDACVHPDGPVLPATPEYFGPNRRVKIGLASYCRECARVTGRDYAKKHREKIAEDPIGYEEYKRRDREAHRYIYQRDRDRIVAQKRELRGRNRDRNREYDRRKIEKRKLRELNDPELRKRRLERVNQYHKLHRLSNLEKFRGRELVSNMSEEKVRHKREREREWRNRNPHKTRAKNEKRRAMVYSADGEHTPEDIQFIYEQQQGHCFYCGIQLNGTYDVDHFIPLSRGGSNGPHNLLSSF